VAIRPERGVTNIDREALKGNVERGKDPQREGPLKKGPSELFSSGNSECVNRRWAEGSRGSESNDSLSTRSLKKKI